ncbi:ABC transporter permease [Streptomyces sp. JJ66]|uniref:ABC transporter permease n=1 Tax=Streptomyces sp. JJ66 TaxID=2803843 RepID=UPI001C57B889|nr:ABC transporter permease [Streptomyces sp. JJ66]MBW1602562.1 ABC transporter permease [Streptomyces sp. JJ66]
MSRADAGTPAAGENPARTGRTAAARADGADARADQAGAAAATGGGRPGPPAASGRPPRWWTLGLLSSELALTLRRGRTLALLAILAVLPVLIGVAVKIETGGGDGSGGDGGGPPFINQVTNNGLFLVFTALAATLPFFLPMTVGVVAGDCVAGEAASGTLRYLLVAPAGRTRLLLAKFAAVVVFCLLATLVVAVSALLVGVALFPVGDITLLSGVTVSFAEGLVRALVIALAVTVSLLGLAALGLFISTLTGSGIAAMAATVGLLITVQILAVIPQLDVIHPYLFPYHWLSFADLLRAPVRWDDVLANAGLQALYVAVFGSAAWARFTTRDVTA